MHRRILLPILGAFLFAAAMSARAQADTTVFSTDFESGVPPEISAPGSILDAVQGYAGLGPVGHKFGGQFLRYTAVPLSDTRLTVRNLPAHDHLSVGFLLGVIDSWDGTELFQVTVDGTMLFNHWFQLALGDSSDYIAPPGGVLSRGTDLGFSLGGYYARDRAYEMALEPAFQNIAHTADSVVVVWKLGAISGPAANQWQGGADESWAIDGVRVSVSAVLDVPRPGAVTALALEGAHPNPSAASACRVAFRLPSDDPARLELIDLAGRLVARQDVGELGAGRHVVQLSPGRALPAGIYMIRLTQRGQSRVTRAAIMN